MDSYTVRDIINLSIHSNRLTLHSDDMADDHMNKRTTEEEEETAWTDACIRWEDDANNGVMLIKKTKQNSNGGDEQDEDEEDGPSFDPFADPDPTQEFTFTFTVDGGGSSSSGSGSGSGSRSSSSSSNNKTNTISITIDGYKADSDETWQSTGLTLWKASHQLNDYILQHYSEWRGQNILELGAGLGVCGILLDRLLILLSKNHHSTMDKTNDSNHIGNEDGDATASPLVSTSDPPTVATTTTTATTTIICLTDGDTEALPVLRENLKRNGAQERGTSVQTSCRQLLWGKETVQRFLRSSCQEERCYNVLLASDIIYAPSVLVPLWETVDLLLTERTGGVFVLAFAKREVPVQVEDVLRTATDFGFLFEEKTQENKEGVFLFEFRRKG